MKFWRLLHYLNRNLEKFFCWKCANLAANRPKRIKISNFLLCKRILTFKTPNFHFFSFWATLSQHTDLKNKQQRKKLLYWHIYLSTQVLVAKNDKKTKKKFFWLDQFPLRSEVKGSAHDFWSYFNVKIRPLNFFQNQSNYAHHYFRLHLVDRMSQMVNF